MPVMPPVSYPGVYAQEVSGTIRSIEGVSTSIAVFIGRTKLGPLNKPKHCPNYEEFEKTFSSAYAKSDLARSVRLFFQNGGTRCYVVRIATINKPSLSDYHTAFDMLDRKVWFGGLSGLPSGPTTKRSGPICGTTWVPSCIHSFGRGHFRVSGPKTHTS